MVLRVLPIAGFAVASLGSSGCVGAWDTLTSRRFREEPMTTMQRMMVPEDPVAVLRANPPRDGDERARAMARLKEPLKANGTQQDQDEMIDLLARTATADGSPVLRAAAINALGRFDDPRAPGILMAAYQNAHGRPAGSPNPVEPAVQPAGAGGKRPPVDRMTLAGPIGFAPDTTAALRCITAESLGRTNKPEAARFLASVATGANTDAMPEGADDPEIRQAAVRGLTTCRQPEAVVALAQVLGKEAGKDAVMTRQAHGGLVRLTGKKLPPDPQQWNEVVQAGVVIAPEPTWFDNAVESAANWMKQ